MEMRVHNITQIIITLRDFMLRTLYFTLLVVNSEMYNKDAIATQSVVAQFYCVTLYRELI